ncbi:MAG: restriction endonuclease subunit S [Plesiomonas sp.]
MGKYQAYPEYKSSGVEWVGYIPTEWEMWKLSHSYHEIGSGTTPPTTSDEWFGGDIPWVTTGELRETIINETKKNVSQKTLAIFSALKIYPAGSVAMAMYGATIGRLGIFGIDATTNQACCVMTKSNVIDNKYLFYWLWAFRQDIINLSSGGGQPNINQEKVASLKISAPIMDEQTQIANFLDHETAKIDALIEKQQQLISLLQEKRQAVISHAVTKGLNPDAPMKDSGVEWLGKVPEHWDISKLKYFSSIQGGFAFSSESFVEEGVQILRIGNLYQNRLALERQPTFVSNKFLSELESYHVKAGDILISLTGTLGKRDYGFAVKVDEKGEFLLNQRVAKLLPFEDSIDPDYLIYLLWSDSYLTPLYSLPSGTKQANLANSDVLGITVAIPPAKEEQTQIANYLKNNISTIDATISKAEAVICLMQERRTALISAAVTGKIDVRNWQAPSQSSTTSTEEQAL